MARRPDRGRGVEVESEDATLLVRVTYTIRRTQELRIESSQEGAEMAAPYRCGTARRRAAVRDAATVNGIEYLEVSADQQTLEVLFLHDLPGGGGQAPVPSSPD